MPRQSASRRRIIAAALDLFQSQGFAATTTKQIAELAQVNEVTLFRNFGSKHDLLLEAIEVTGVLTRISSACGEEIAEIASLPEAIRYYARDRLQAWEQQSELLRAFVGEAGQYSPKRRRALGRAFLQGIQEIAQHFARFLDREPITVALSPEQFAGLLNSLLLGYLITELTGEFQELWGDREDFLDSVVKVCLQGVMPPSVMVDLDAPQLAMPNSTLTRTSLGPTEFRVADLPADVVRKILLQAKQQGVQHYALVYLLFAAGLLPEEVLGLERSHHICTSRQHLIHITQGTVRQVPINQWIMGKRYGSYGNNPLSQWLKSRKDDEAALFISERGQPLSEPELMTFWQEVTAKRLAPAYSPPRIVQARQTWCVEMLIKGMNPEDLSILSGWTLEKLQPFVRRAREKVALERAIQLDKQSH
ncbi:MAG: TetR family transcriptional regulator [Cyanobacteria bacterium J06641_5]